MKIAVVGLGYIGSVSCGCLAHLGHEVVGLDIDPHKVDALAEGRPPVIEQGLAALVATAHQEGRLTATHDVDVALAGSDVALVCVATPSRPDGGADDSQLIAAVEAIGQGLRRAGRDTYTVIVRSTCLPDVHRRLQAILATSSGLSYEQGLGYASNPEFLREGSAVEDFFAPPKIVFGARGKGAEAVCRDLYLGIAAETFFMDPGAAALVKYADNYYHAVKVTFGNEIGLLCQQLGVDPYAVMDVFCKDRKLNISSRYLRPGAPFGGSCLPKDVRALRHVSREMDVPLKMLQGVDASNRYQIERLVARIEAADPVAVGFVGLSFKEGTPDLRESPFLEILRRLVARGRVVRVYDPLLLEMVATPDHDPIAELRPHLAEDLASLAVACDYLIVTQKLGTQMWDGLQIGREHHLLDLTADADLRRFGTYEELYR
ncbi:MAG: nucleotide sugar dehydrogenase [Pseudomonadota bacterium]|nr:nucleotide sugar dehydrogenase [Pseudomonadota bacterium]